MASKTSMKLGFVFKLSEEMKTEQSFYEIKKCKNKNCKNHFKNMCNVNFCSECGSEIVTEKVKQEDRFLSCYDFCEKYFDGEDILVTDNGGLPENIWLYNHKIDDQELNNLCYEGDFYDEKIFIDLSGVDLVSAIEKFKQLDEVKLILEIFEREFGKDKISVNYGYYSVIY